MIAWMMSSITSSSDGIQPHLRLGITAEGMYWFLLRIGYFVPHPDPEEAEKEHRAKRGNVFWRYGACEPTDFEQHRAPASDEKNGWLRRGHPGVLTGYDCKQYIERWQRRWTGGDVRKQNQSVCETILADDSFRDLRKYVGHANKFISHSQTEGFLFTIGSVLPSGDPDMAPIECGDRDSILWLDYFSLRQIQKGGDFDVSQIMMLIQEIPHFLCVARPGGDYFAKSFCIWELFAAIKGKLAGKVTVLMYPWYLIGLDGKNDDDIWRRIRRDPPFKSLDARCRNKEDEKAVDAAIIAHLTPKRPQENKSAHEVLDDLIYNAMVDGAGFDYCQY